MKKVLSIFLASLLTFLLGSAMAVPAGELYRPQNTPVSSKRIYLGDSRTVGMYRAVCGGGGDEIAKSAGEDYWCAKVGAGYPYMNETAIPKAEASGIPRGTKIFFLFGVNDMANAEQYASRINAFAEKWNREGATVYFVSVNPVNDEKTRNAKNARIEDFNASVRKALRGVRYVDTYSGLYPSLSTDPALTDREGLHYTKDTYLSLYSTLRQQ